MNRATYTSMALVLAAVSLAVVACGDDDTGTAPTAAPTSPAPATTAAATTAAATTAAAGGDTGAWCALAQEVADQGSPPSDDQLARYMELAPAEITADVQTAAAPLIAAPDGDVLAFFKVIAADDVEQSLARINAAETATCGIPHDEEELAVGATREVEPGAARVDVRAEDFTLALPTEIAAGRTSFVLTNHGAEVHHLAIFRLADGVTMEQLFAAEDDEGLITGEWSTGLAFPDGGDEEAVTFDLEPGHYGVACFVSGADGTPHAFGHDMIAEFFAT